MSRIAKRISENFILLVSIPRNSLDLAMAAEESGADAIKVHLNCVHRASGTKFGTWKEERKEIEKILSKLTIPVGIVPGAQVIASHKEMIELENMDFDFWDIFAHHLPAYFLELQKMGRMAAVDYTFDKAVLEELERMKIQIIEGSIIEPEGYGFRITARDIARYRTLVKSTKLPVIIPTQRKITAGDIPYIADAGVRGIAIGAIVTGHTVKELEAAALLFKKAIDSLKYVVTEEIPGGFTN
ncbi:MAG: hypothetical protein M1536_05210 [Firmicutes bacterium]|nr:hypothetical protein [Bacillota bacterium]